MQVKRKCKKGIAIQTDLNRQDENAIEDYRAPRRHKRG